jgi:hypothetical protein
METCRVLEKARRQIRDTVPRRWPLHRWPLHRWPLHRWPLHRWPLHRWHRIGSAPTVYRLHPYGVSAPPLRCIGSTPTVYRLHPYAPPCLRKAAERSKADLAQGGPCGAAEQGGPCGGNGWPRQGGACVGEWRRRPPPPPHRRTAAPPHRSGAGGECANVT